MNSMFKVGDLVQVAGIQGPIMRVMVMKEDGCNCLWFDRENHMNVIEFPFAALEPAPEEARKQRTLQ